MKALGHGANIAEMAAQYGKRIEEVIDFSSNINPFVSESIEGMLPSLLEAAKNYPDIYYTALREEIATYLNCEKEQVIVGNGATEIMYLLMKSLYHLKERDTLTQEVAISSRHQEHQNDEQHYSQEVHQKQKTIQKQQVARKMTLGIVHPTFSEYERSARLNGIEIMNLYLRREVQFVLDEKYIEEQLSQIDALFICNPNNPTGNVHDLKRLIEVMKAQDKWLIVDETFMEFVEAERIYTLVPFVKSYKKLIVIKAITKFFGLPGLRLGYGVTSHEGLLETMYHYKEPWTVNSFAEHLAGPLLRDKVYQKESKAYFKEERDLMLEALEALEGVVVYPTATNFVLLRLEGMTAKAIKEKLFQEDSILIRDASNFKGLDEHFIRVAIKAPKDNQKLITALKKHLN